MSATRASGGRIANDTAFRIASMTKSFTALAILKLRDEGDTLARGSGLEVDSGVRADGAADARYAAAARPPVAEPQRGLSGRQPVGDQQLSDTDAALDAWLRAGIPFSTPPGTRYEYSNYAFGLLGRIVTRPQASTYETYCATRSWSRSAWRDSTLRVL